MAELAEAMNDMTARFQEIRDDLDAQVKQRTQGSRAQRATGQRRLSGRRRGPRDQQPAGLDRLVRRIARRAAARRAARRRSEPRRRASTPKIEILRKYLRRIQDEAFRCKGITEKLLDFSRLGDVEKQDTDLGELVQGVIDMVRHLGKYREKKIEFDCREYVVAPVNAQEIKQVVLNLITNALDSLDRRRHRLDRARQERPVGRAGRSRQRLRHDRRSAASTCSSRSSPAAATARARAWGCRSPIASSPITAARSSRPATGRAGARSSASCCRSLPRTRAHERNPKRLQAA